MYESVYPPEAAEILFFSRGRGKGHAIPDLAIAREFRKICPNSQIVFASYGTGAETLRSAGERVINLDLPERNPFLGTLIRAGAVIRTLRSGLVVSHEEPAALVAAKIFGIPTVFLTHWFIDPKHVYMRSLEYADTILFIDRPGIFTEPDYLKGKVRYVGPVLRAFEYGPSDRERSRQELGIESHDDVILVLPGNWFSEGRAPCRELIFDAFRLLQRPSKRLVWVAGVDRDEITRYIQAGDRIDVIDSDPKIDRLMVASDLAITKGTHNTTNELSALGKLSISLSHGLNPLDDVFCQSVSTNTFLQVQKTEPSTLAHCIDQALNAVSVPADVTALHGAGAAKVASFLHALLYAQRLKGRRPQA